MFSLSIPHCIIWCDKCYLLVHIIVETHLLEISMNCCWVHQPPPHSLLGLMMNFCFRTRFHSTFPRGSYNVVSSICFAPFLLRHPESEVSKHRSYLNLGHIWWLEHFSKSYNTGLLWPGKVMSCPAHLAGGPTVIVSLLARLSILPWGNC